MLYTHHFGSVATSSRARFWLNWHGFDVEHADLSAQDGSRLALNLDFSRASAAQALIDSIERSDPAGWPGLLSATKDLHAHGSHARPEEPASEAASRHAPIHWQSREDAAGDPAAIKVSEYMLGRWE